MKATAEVSVPHFLSLIVWMCPLPCFPLLPNYASTKACPLAFLMAVHFLLLNAAALEPYYRLKPEMTSLNYLFLTFLFPSPLRPPELYISSISLSLLSGKLQVIALLCRTILASLLSCTFTLRNNLSLLTVLPTASTTTNTLNEYFQFFCSEMFPTKSSSKHLLSIIS